MSTSSFDYITNSAKSVLERLFPESSARQKRIQELVIEIEDMERSSSILEFGAYFDKLVEMKDLLLSELVTVYTTLRKQDVELERLNIIVLEKNKAISTLATENEHEKDEYKTLQSETKELKQKLKELETQEVKYRAIMSKVKKSDSAQEELEEALFP